MFHFSEPIGNNLFPISSLELRVQGLRNYITFKVSLDPRTYPYQALKPSLEWPEKDNKYYS